MIVNRELAISSGVDQKDLWETPKHIYDALNREFQFTLDPCCTVETAKCAKYYTPLEDGLIQSWRGHTVFCNPPYSRGNIDKWVEKCYTEGWLKRQEYYPHAPTVVALLPVSTSAEWWHKYIVSVPTQIRFIERRVRFVGAPFTAPFSSVIVIWNGAGVYSFPQSK